MILRSDSVKHQSIYIILKCFLKTYYSRFLKWKTLKLRIMYFIRRVIWKPLNTLQLRQKNWSSKLFSSFFSLYSLSFPPFPHSFTFVLSPRFDDVVPQNNTRKDWVEVLWFGSFFSFFVPFIFTLSFSLTL